MTELTRWILAVDSAGQRTDDGTARFESWARDAAAMDGVIVAEMETIDRAAHAAHTGRSELPRFVALLSVWCDDLDATSVLEGAHEHGVGRVVPFRVEQCMVRIDFPRDWADGEPTPGLKKSTFWQANPTVGSSWRERYARHADIVRDHHSSAWRYRQNLLSANGDDVRWDAVSELWWPAPDGLLERFYNSAASQLVVRDDTVFVGRAMPIVTTHTILRSVPTVVTEGTA